jgi:hypothetical protein
MNRNEAALNSNSHTVEHLEPSCGVFVDLCAGRLWRPLPDGNFEPLGDADKRLVVVLLERMVGSKAKARTEPELLAFEQVETLTSIKRKTLYEWKRTGKLRREHGLRMIGRLPRIDWSAFKSCIEKGGLS